MLLSGSMLFGINHYIGKNINTLLCYLVYLLPASSLRSASRYWGVVLWIPYTLHISWSPISASFFQTFVSTICPYRMNIAAFFVGSAFLLSSPWSSALYIPGISLRCFSSLSFYVCLFAEFSGRSFFNFIHFYLPIILSLFINLNLSHLELDLFSYSSHCLICIRFYWCLFFPNLFTPCCFY